MKILILVGLMTFAQFSYGKNCSTDNSYLKSEWNITYPRNFDQLHKDLMSQLSHGLQSESIIKDLDGVLTTNQGHLNRLYMHVRSWDHLDSPENEMFGDIAIFTNRFNKDEVLELRWYKNGVKHIAVNPAYLSCVSIHAPMPTNTIF